MNDTAPPDVHAPEVRELTLAGNWPALIRYWMAHPYLPALDESIELVARRTQEGGPWPRLVAWLRDFREDPNSFDRVSILVGTTGFDLDERRSLRMLEIFPGVALCELAAQYPIGEQQQAYRFGNQSVDQALSLSDEQQEPALSGFLLNLRARSLFSLSDLEGARVSFNEALRIRRELAVSQPEVYCADVAMTLNHVGNNQSVLGDLEGASLSYDEALKIGRELAVSRPEVYRPIVAMTLINLGNAQRDLGDPEGSRISYIEALTIYREMAVSRPDVYRAEEATTLNNLGNAQRDLGDPEGALDSNVEALIIYRELAVSQPEVYRTDVAMALNNLGNAQHDLGGLERARASYDEALRIRRELAVSRPEVYRASVAMTLINLGNNQRVMGDPQAARVSYEEALTIYRELAMLRPGQSQVERIRLAQNLGRLSLTDNLRLGWPDRRGARAILKEGFAVAEVHRGRFVDPRQRKRVQEETSNLYGLLLRVCVESWQLDGDLDALRDAVEVAEASRARRLMEQLAEEELQPAHAPPGMLEEFLRLRARLREAERQLDFHADRVVQEPESFPGEGGSGEPGNATRMAPRGRSALAERLQEVVAQTTPVYHDLLRQLQANDPEFNPDRPVPPIDLDQMVQLIPRDIPTAVVLFTVTADLGVALIVTAQGVDVVLLPDLTTRNGLELATSWDEAYRKTCQHPDGRLDLMAWAAAISGLLEPVAEVAIRPVIRKLEGRGFERLILLPNRTLHLFPLHACTLDDGRFLADVYEVAYAPSLSILDRCQRRKRAEPRRILTIENPTLDLDFVGFETNSVAGHYTERTNKKGSEAQRDWLLEHPAGFDTWHYSGHSGFDPNDALASGLVLEGHKVSDRWLTLRDIFTSLRLTETGLVVLSGCESGVIRPDPIDEMIGFPGGFLFAGATCVVASLWTVQDLATALMMCQFYREWRVEKKPIATALREAQRWLREDFKNGQDVVDLVATEDFKKHVPDNKTREKCEWEAKRLRRNFPDSPPFASPAYWAAFTATGWGFIEADRGLVATASEA